jgi:hypothetical protein
MPAACAVAALNAACKAHTMGIVSLDGSFAHTLQGVFCTALNAY